MGDNLETYHPQFVKRDEPDKWSLNVSQDSARGSRQSARKGSSKLSKLRIVPNLGNKWSRHIDRISSLDSTRSSSSYEADNSAAENLDSIRRAGSTSIRMDGRPPAGPSHRLDSSNVIKGHSVAQKSTFGASDSSTKDDEIDDENDDQFQASPMRAISSAFKATRDDRDNFQGKPNSILNTYEDLLDDRQGMNNSENQFTKGERVTRPSLDGSISSEIRDKKNSIPGRGTKKGDKHGKRSKSPTSSGLRRGRQSRRGLFGLASRLKLTRRYESIAKFQLSILNSGFISLKKLDRDLQSFLPKSRMTSKELDDHVKLIRKYPVLAKIEYKFANRYETYVCRHAMRESNQIKNNHKKCIPYDYNRVVLKTIPDVANSDYINASHVDSYLKPNAYIAAQGPNENTIEDFWRMVWEQRSFVIVMLTKVFDFIKVMCNQYWPVDKNKPERYGNLEVTLLFEEPLADFVIRTIKLTKIRANSNTNQSAVEPETKPVIEESQDSSQKDESAGEMIECDDDMDNDESLTEEVVFNSESYANNQAQAQAQKVPRVRAPRFISVHQASTRRRSISAEDMDLKDRSRAKGPRSQKPSNLNLNSAQSITRSNSFREAAIKTELLHPTFGLKPGAFGGSSTSIVSMPNSPTTPITPTSPNSPGIDRSSATRKAVKKKRRARVKDDRPMRTEFMAPDENQLLDDDDDVPLDKWGKPIDQGESNGLGKQPSERIIYQFHYNSWASHTCPFVSSLLHFRRRVRICMDEMAKSGRTGPTIVHCNDGCGRTGTYLCIDANLELAEEDNLYDVFNFTKKLRQSRKFLIENLDQYKFVYDTIEEAMFCGRTWFPVTELHQKLKHKSQRNPITKNNEYQVEYEKICRMTGKFSIGDCAGGHRVENREKNRDVSTVPPDNFRPYLTSFQTNDSTDYINAVFVDGYTRSKEYIVTEWPLHKTISDFWSLIYDHDCNSVILLANPGESSNYPSFLPSEKELRRKFGSVFSAEMVSYTHYQNIKSWIYTINKRIVSLTEVIAGVKSEAKTTQVFQITCWPQGHRVPTSTNALVELMNMVERWRQRTAYGPVCVVSLNGKSRAGVYCAANVAIEQVVQHGEVDVFQAVKTVRRHRPQLIENMTEYKYCYDLILHYVLHYLNHNSGNA